MANDKKLWPVFSEFIRLRDSDEKGFCKCFTCGAIRYFRQMDCGHGVKRQHMATKYHERNNHAQCKICNGPIGGGKPKEYRVNMNKKYGAGTWEEIEFLARTVCKFGKFEIEAMMFHFKEEVKKMKQTKDLKVADLL
jgi:hypothetical protein